ncbi:hypothetical protein ACT4UT_21245 [Bacillus sp. B-TM1]
MSKKLVKPILNGILFLGVFLFAHTYLKNVSFTRYFSSFIKMDKIRSMPNIPTSNIGITTSK